MSDDELRRWMAGKLGWTETDYPLPGRWNTGTGALPQPLYSALSGWMGLGRVVGWCKAQGWAMSINVNADGYCIYLLRPFMSRWEDFETRYPDPALAAIKAVYAATEAQR